MWEKIKFWMKAIAFAVVALFVGSFLLVNRNARVQPALDFVVTKLEAPSLLAVLFWTSVLSIFGWWLLRTLIKATRQWRKMQEKSRTAKLEKEVAEMKAKAGMLQTKETAAAAAPKEIPPVE